MLAAFAVLSVGNSQAEEKKEAGGSLEEKMLGYWAPDAKQMLELIKKEIGEDPNAAAMIPMIQGMLASMAIEVKKGEVNMHAMGELQKSTYKITKEDKETKKLTMMVTEGEGDAEEEGTATIDGNKLTLSKDGDDIILNRIDKAEFDKRMAAAEKPPGLPIPE